MNRLRNRLIIAFLAATVIPLAATLWIATSLLDRSLAYTTTKELDDLSKELELTAREFYQQARENLKAEAAAGRLTPKRYAAGATTDMPVPVKEFHDSEEFERFALSGTSGERLDYFVRHGQDVWVYSRTLGNVRMQSIAEQYRRAREIVTASGERDLRRGFTITLIVLVVAVWFVALISL